MEADTPAVFSSGCRSSGPKDRRIDAKVGSPALGRFFHPRSLIRTVIPKMLVCVDDYGHRGLLLKIYAIGFKAQFADISVRQR